MFEFVVIANRSPHKLLGTKRWGGGPAAKSDLDPCPEKVFPVHRECR